MNLTTLRWLFSLAAVSTNPTQLISNQFGPPHAMVNAFVDTKEEATHFSSGDNAQVKAFLVALFIVGNNGQLADPRRWSRNVVLMLGWRICLFTPKPASSCKVLVRKDHK